MSIILDGTTGITSTGITETADGNVGIGTSSPSTLYKLTVSDSVYISSGADVTPDAGWSGQLTINGDGYSGGLALDSSGIWLGNNSVSRAVIFATNETERARITSSGVFVGTDVLPDTSNNGTAIRDTQNGASRFSGSGTGGRTVLAFYNGNGLVGQVATSGSSTSYTTSSDYRLKEDWQPMTAATERVKALKPVNFAWKVDGSRVDGFLAHEAQAVVPEAVTGEKDAVDDEGNPVYQGIDQAKLVPLLTAALQEALAEINSLKSRLDAANL